MNSSHGNLPKNLTRLRFEDDRVDVAELLHTDIARGQRAERIIQQHLLSSVRVTRNIMPVLSKSIDQCFDVLKLNMDPHVFVFNDPNVNAFCYGASKDIVCIGVTSALVNLMRPEEIAFVIGHELGHFVFEHWRYPLPENAVSEAENLNLLALKRNAEISADRVGFLASGEQDTAFRAILKSVSGVNEEMLRFDFSGYLQQLKQIRKKGVMPGALEQTHPSFPVRLRALLWFSMSQPYHAYTGTAGTGTMTRADLDERIRKDLASLRGGILSEINHDTLHEAAFWGTLYCFSTDARLTKAEQSYLQTFFGKEATAMGVQSLKRGGAASVLEKFEKALRSVSLLKAGARAQFLESLVTHSEVASGDKKAKDQFLANLRMRIL